MYMVAEDVVFRRVFLYDPFPFNSPPPSLSLSFLCTDEIDKFERIRNRIYESSETFYSLCGIRMLSLLFIFDLSTRRLLLYISVTFCYSEFDEQSTQARRDIFVNDEKNI